MSGRSKVCIKSGQVYGRLKHVKKISHGKTPKSKDIIIWGKVLATHVTDKELISLIYKECPQIDKKTNNAWKER